LEGTKIDMNEISKMLDNSNFNTEDPVRSRNEKLGELTERLAEFKAEIKLQLDPKFNPITPHVVVFLYYTGHGCMKHEDEHQNTWIVTKENEYYNIT
jgi:hypothetical protein